MSDTPHDPDLELDEETLEELNSELAAMLGPEPDEVSEDIDGHPEMPELEELEG